MHDRSKKRQFFLQSYESAMFGKRENIVFISANLRVSNILRDSIFSAKNRQKSSIYRRFFQFIGDLSPFFQFIIDFLEMARVLGA